MEDVINKVCEHFGVSPIDIAKAKSNYLREYTYKEIISRVITTNGRLRLEFQEMNETTILKLLKRIFPGKPNNTRGYDRYILSCINMKKCHKCSSIKSIFEFNKSNKETDGLDTRCISCYKDYYNNNRETLLQQKKEYGVEHLAEKLANNAKRRATKLKATPSWANLDAIKLIYQCAEGAHVDHEVPLQGELVCGLHVEYNLQYLTPAENMAKGNKFDPETYVHTLP
jgi:hypothetical protein